MDKLLSEQKVLKTIDNLKANFTCYDSVTLDEVYSHVKAIPPAEPFKGMTNGEVIKAVFPNVDIEYRKISVYVTISPLTNLVIFDKDWWDSPYVPQESEG